ncbi:Type 1 glutamine amidotransferase-like domain-containing protein [Chryseobacterium sp. ISL-6]|uniref:cyanophycinase n=1 Tax=Chryseobacterium sp. ISL-6 TaxID=2819143 RepID=UPI001BE52D4E|nr:Type 1 glutamine amidotransferase-like domain-containing protein [Chryseobacterium sp. ISL-6]MBT2620115.1 Type 1 glutamine amidotransferase-like domain-containing protein [Chryseobacterium sp. ISL-6]
MVPQGRLLIIGDRQFNHSSDKIDNKNYNFPSREILDLLSKIKTDRIEIITPVCFPESFIEDCSNILYEMGYTNFDFLPINNGLTDEKYLQRFSDAQTIFFIGDQTKTYNILKSSGIIKVLYRKYIFEDTFTVAGMSLGAMCIPGIMIHENINNNFELIPGLGFLNNCIVDTQFVHKTRFKKLVHTIIQNRDFLGLGLGENTALMIEKGCLASCRGTGTVMMINAKNVIPDSNLSNDKSIFLKNLKGRILVEGCTINLNSGEVA